MIYEIKGKQEGETFLNFKCVSKCNRLDKPRTTIDAIAISTSDTYILNRIKCSSNPEG